MADTFSTNLKVRLPETGQYFNSWGTTLNSDAINLLDEAVSGEALIALGAATAFAMPALTPGASSNSRKIALLITGTPASEVTITLPGSVTTKFYLADNQCGQEVLFTYGGAGATVVVPAGERKLIWCDGANVYGITSSDATTISGITISQLARLDEFNTFDKAFTTPFVTLTDIANIQVDCTLSNCFIVTLAGNRNIDLNTPADGQTIRIWVRQDGTGGRTLTWPANVQFANNTNPGLSVSGNDVDEFTLTYNVDLNLWIATYSVFSPPSAAVVNVRIVSNTKDVNVFALAGSPSGPYTVNFLLDVGAVAQASDPRSWGIDFSGFDAGSIINFTNRGYVLGAGGEGGDGASGQYPGSGATMNAAKNGKDGGPAIKGPGTGRTFNVTNGQGNIWGGGGGGGGGGAGVSNLVGGNNVANSGGGGAGAGGAEGGDAGDTWDFMNVASTATDGGSSGAGISSAPGTGGVGYNKGTASSAAGGDGGDWGTAGNTGGVAAGEPILAPPGTGGAAGKAIDLNGGAVTFISGSGAPHVIGSVA